MSELRVLFFGTPDFAAQCLAALIADSRYKVTAVITQPDREAGRGKIISPPPVKILALKHNIAVLQPRSVKKELSSILEALQPHAPFDIGVVVAFGQLLPLEMLNFPRAGSVNVHASLLPRWRGAAPIQRAIMAGDKETGVALMKMEAGLDTGPVYCEKRVEISSQDTAGSLMATLAKEGSELLRARLADICAARLTPARQAETGVTYATKISNDEARVDWNRPARDISSLIRALNPAPGAFTLLTGRRLKIHAAEAHDGDYKAAPGSVVRISKQGIEVQCGRGILTLIELQLEGKKRMPADEFVNGKLLSTQDVLGS